MSRPTRRSLLASVAAGAAGAGATTALAGCLGGASPTEATDPWRSRDRIDDGVRGQLRLRRGEFFRHPFDLSAAGHIFLRARERLSLPVDLMTFEAESGELAAYRAGDPADPINTYSVLGVTRAQIERRIPDGSYVLIVDNTRLGEARPFDTVDVGLELRIER